VAESHGGTVSLEHPTIGTGTRFVIRIPIEPFSPTDGENGAEAQTSTTTGNTMGRRRSRS
jgi:hypothetical protein